MNSSSTKKILAILINTLFIGISIAPSISAEMNRTNNVEITVNIYGLGYIEEKTVSVSEEEINEIKSYINEIKFKLEKAETREEVTKIFEDSIMTLNNFNLLSKDLSIENIHKSIFGEDTKNAKNFLIDNIFDGYPTDINENYFCLTAGETTNTVSYGPVWRSSIRLWQSLGNIFISLYDRLDAGGFYYIANLVEKLFGIPLLLSLFLIILSSPISNLNPIPIGGNLCLGKHQASFFGADRYYPAEGWIYTIGLNGIKEWNGSFYGQLPLVCGPWFLRLFGSDFYPGLYCFTGIKLGFLGNYFYFGTTLGARIGPEPPWD